MTPEQLVSARAALWREDAQPIATLDDAKAWLRRVQLCLYLPRRTHVLAPAPSFVGAVHGSSTATPPAESIALAQELLVRLVAEGEVVPLNLFGTPGEQPDFLIATSALTHLAALQADRNWKKPPVRTGPGKVSPLAIEIWKVLDREGALTAIEMRGHLGHELTEAAIVRGLSELWQNLRVAPLPQPEGQPAHWEILSLTHKNEMAAGGTLAQSTALSMLVSYYIQSVVTATAEDIEAFLSPVASRSRLRDVIRGLGATRQLKTLSMDARTFLFVDGTLPDMPEAAVAETPADEAKPAFMGRSAYRARMSSKKKEDQAVEDTSPRTYRDRRGEGGPDRPRRAAAAGDRPPHTDRPSRFAADGRTRPSRPSFGDRSRGASSDRPRPSYGADRSRAGGGSARPRSGSARPPFRKTEGDPTAERPRTPRPFPPREGASRPPFRGKATTGGSQPFRARTVGDGPRTPRTNGERPRTSRPDDARPRGSRPFSPREGAPRPPFRGKAAGSGSRPFRPRTEDDRPRKAGSDKDRPRANRPFTPLDGSSRPPFRGKPPERPAQPFKPRPGEDRSSRADGKGRPSRPAANYTRRERPARSESGRPDRPSSGAPDRPSGQRPSRPSSSGERSSSRPFSSRPFSTRPSSRPGARSGPSGSEGRSQGSQGRPAGRPDRPRSAAPRPSRPGQGGPKPGAPRAGGLRPPTRKPRKETENE